MVRYGNASLPQHRGRFKVLTRHIDRIKKEQTVEFSRRTFVKLCGAAAGAVGLGGTVGAGNAAAQAAAGGGGVILPKPHQPSQGTPAMFAKDASYPPLQPIRPPDGAPNVAIILIDDMGFGASSAFGGPCNMPTLERLANDGLRYSRFHTT